MSTPQTAIQVYQAIANVAGEMAAVGIAKDKRASTGKSTYNFRGIDDVYNALAPMLAKHKLVILPRVIDRQVTERTSAAGNLLFYTTLTMEFDFVSAEDGSKHTVCTMGEAMDSGDKSTNKAMSAAYKYAAFQAFCIPVDVVDSEQDTHTVAPASRISATAEVAKQVPVHRQAALESVASSIREAMVKDPSGLAAHDIFYQMSVQEEQVYVWNKLPSGIRSTIKSVKDAKAKE